MGWIMDYGLTVDFPSLFTSTREPSSAQALQGSWGAPFDPLRLGLHVRLRPIKSSPYFQKEIPSFDYGLAI